MAPTSQTGRLNYCANIIFKFYISQLVQEMFSISKTAKEHRTFIESMAAEDPILKGVPEDKNPFKEKGGCTIS
uniref:Guanine nucleotide-binding protein subunit gamma n=1 Tax=Pseudonaja textilis TaxID=8673 RepID=A0A670ZEV0_PSETE